MFWKIPTIIGYLYFQQLALKHGLMTVASIYPLISVLATVSIGAAYFGDTVQRFTITMFIGATGMLMGIVLLSAPREWIIKEDTETVKQVEVEEDISIRKDSDVDTKVDNSG